MSCGKIALDIAGIPIKKYYSSEIDRYAHKVAYTVHNDVIPLHDINYWRQWNMGTSRPDIMLAGSPCQGFSFAGKRLNFEDPRSKLFFTFIEALKHCKPKYFILENVIMSKQSNDVISRTLGAMYPECSHQTEMFQARRLEPIVINSMLVSAQSRPRNYWTNIPGIEQPKDRGIYLRDIIESGEAPKDKSYCITKSMSNGLDKRDIASNQGKRQVIAENKIEGPKIGRIVGRPIHNPKCREPGHPTKQMLEIREDEKSNCLSTAEKDNVLVYNRCKEVGKADIKGHDYNRRVYSQNGKSPSLCGNTGGNLEPKITGDNISWRKLTPRECGRLQTIPEDILERILNCGVSNSQLYKIFGNGWNVETIAHILSFIPELKRSC